MDLEDLKEKVAALHEDEQNDPSTSIQMLLVKLGQMAEGEIRMDMAEELDAETEEGLRSDLLAGVLFATMHYADEHDLDIEEAVEERMKMMKMAKAQAEAAKQLRDAGAMNEEGEIDTDLDPSDDRAYM